MKGKKGMALHSCSENKEMNHTLVKDMGVCWIRGEEGGGVFEGCFQDHFNIFTEGATEARPG